MKKDFANGFLEFQKRRERKAGIEGGKVVNQAMCRALHRDNRELPESFELLVATNAEPEKVFMKLVTNIPV